MHQMEHPKKEKAKEDYDLLCLHCISHFGNEGKWERFGYGRCNRCDKTRHGWISYVYLNRKLLDIGRHVSEVDAARNHDRILYMRYGIKDNLNFPEEYNLSD